MGQRLDLQEKLQLAIGIRSDHKPNVFFQPPSGISMVYPCIVYQRDSVSEIFADNILYLGKKAYLITVIDSDPESEIPDKIAKFPLASFDRHYTADNLNHDVYLLYF